MSKTVIFDLDGTLIDTEPAIYASFRYTFETMKPDVELTDELIKSFIGPTLVQSFSRFSDDENEIMAMVNLYREHNIPAQQELVSVFPNVIETLSKLKTEGYKLAICTSKLEDSAVFGMKLCEIYEYFDEIICLDHVSTPKPSPEGINIILERFGVDKSIMVGDNISDIKAGNNAGITSVGVTWSVHGPEFLQSENPDYLIDDIGEIFDIISKEK